MESHFQKADVFLGMQPEQISWAEAERAELLSPEACLAARSRLGGCKWWNFWRRFALDI